MAKKKAATVSVKDRLRALYQLQMIDSEIDKIRILRGELPMEIEDLEDLITGFSLNFSHLSILLSIFLASPTPLFSPLIFQ